MMFGLNTTTPRVYSVQLIEENLFVSTFCWLSFPQIISLNQFKKENLKSSRNDQNYYHLPKTDLNL